MDAQALRRRSKVNPDEYRTIALAKMYNISPRVIAYIRSAIMSGVYTPQTRIEHIDADNEKRTKSIDDLKAKENSWTPEEQITYTKTIENRAFRTLVKETIERMTTSTMADLIK